MAKLLPFRRLEGSTEEMSDEALVAACALGESAALGALFDRHHRAVSLFIARMLGGSVVDADDLLQATFELLPAIAARFRAGSQVRTWILGVARNVVRRHLRVLARQRKIAVALLAQPSPSAPVLDEEVARRERREKIDAEIGRLPPKLREVFVLVYLLDMSGPEAAQALGVREGTIWKRLHIARKRLRPLLEGLR